MLLVELLMVFLSIFPFAPGSCCCLLHSTNIRCDFHQQSFFLHALQRVLFSLVSSSYFVFSFNKAALIYLALLYPTRHSALRISEEEYTAVPFPTVVMLVIVGRFVLPVNSVVRVSTEPALSSRVSVFVRLSSSVNQ